MYQKVKFLNFPYSHNVTIVKCLEDEIILHLMFAFHLTTHSEMFPQIDTNTQNQD